MTQEAALAGALFVLAFACVIGALRCLADRLLASAALYTLVATGLAVGAGKAALDAV